MGQFGGHIVLQYYSAGAGWKPLVRAICIVVAMPSLAVDSISILSDVLKVVSEQKKVLALYPSVFGSAKIFILFQTIFDMNQICLYINSQYFK